jgi:hypothetical protein
MSCICYELYFIKAVVKYTKAETNYNYADTCYA